MLRSPGFGVDDAALFELAQVARAAGGTWWQALVQGAGGGPGPGGAGTECRNANQCNVEVCHAMTDCDGTQMCCPFQAVGISVCLSTCP